MTTTIFENNETGIQNLKVHIGGQFKDYSLWPTREIIDSVNGTMEEPDFPDPVTDFSQLTVPLGFIISSSRLTCLNSL